MEMCFKCVQYVPKEVNIRYKSTKPHNESSNEVTHGSTAWWVRVVLLLHLLEFNLINWDSLAITSDRSFDSVYRNLRIRDPSLNLLWFNWTFLDLRCMITWNVMRYVIRTWTLRSIIIAITSYAHLNLVLVILPPRSFFLKFVHWFMVRNQQNYIKFVWDSNDFCKN